MNESQYITYTDQREWTYKYDTHGMEGLNESSTWRRYSKDLKLAAVKDSLSGMYSVREVTRMSDASVLRDCSFFAKKRAVVH